MLSHLFPNLPLDKQGLADIVRAVGSRRNSIIAYMKENFAISNTLTLLDGHRILSVASDFPNAELGYDSQQRHSRQINVLYIYSYNQDGHGNPLYYKQYNGGTLDEHAVSDILQEIGGLPKDTTVVGDKGCFMDGELEDLVRKGLYFVVPLRRGNRFAKGRVPAANSDQWESMFYYNGRAVLAISIDAGDYNVHIFFDTKLYADEMASIAGRTDQENSKKMEAVKKALHRNESELKKAEKSLEIAIRKQEKETNRVKMTQERYDKANEAAQKKERLAEEARERLAKRIGTPAEARSQNACKKAEDAARHAREKANLAYLDLENDKIKAKECDDNVAKIQDECSRIRDSIAMIQALSERIEIFNQTGSFDVGFDIDTDFGSTFADLQKMFPLESGDILPGTTEAGTITLLTNRKEDSSETIYHYFKQRNHIEQYFLVYVHSCDFEVSYMRDRVDTEGWLFFNQLSTEMATDCINQIAEIGESKNISFRDAMTMLRKIHAARLPNGWLIPHTNKQLVALCEKLGFSPEKMMHEVNWDTPNSA